MDLADHEIPPQPEDKVIDLKSALLVLDESHKVAGKPLGSLLPNGLVVLVQATHRGGVDNLSGVPVRCRCNKCHGRLLNALPRFDRNRLARN